MDDLKNHLKKITEGMSQRIARQGERQRELEQERQLAAIRQQRHTLVWAGTADELIVTITDWYESGRIVAESLQDAIQKVSIHFVRLDGRPVLEPSIVPTLRPEALSPSVPSVASEGEVKTKESDRKVLRSSYLETFPEAKILDVCWAAGQHYSEWKRWLHYTVKDGSAPDRAFRAILASGKAPQEYRKQRRPNGWK